MDDDIQLPPLPTGLPNVYGRGDMNDYGRDCYMAGLAASRAKKEAKPVGHRAEIALCNNGVAFAAVNPINSSSVIARVTLRWTDDGKRVWIDSAWNRELARSLRRMYHDNAILAAADALDGGER